MRAGTLLAGVAGVGVLLAHLVAILVLDRRVSGLDAEREGNALTWLASSAAGSAAVAALLLAFVPPARRVLIIALGAGLAFLSLDEAAQIHERLGALVVQRLLGGSKELEGPIEPVTILPVMALVFVTVALLALRARRTLRISLLGALALLVLSVLVEQLVGPFTNRQQREGLIWPDAIRNGLEEGLEVAGWIVLAAALFGMVLTRWGQRGRARSA